MSTKLARPKVLKQLEGIPPSLRRVALRRLNAPIRRRHGSDEYARQFPSRAVTPTEKIEMKKFHGLGLSFRAIEEVYHLKPNSGNGAQRCIRVAARLLRQRRKQRPRPPAPEASTKVV